MDRFGRNVLVIAMTLFAPFADDARAEKRKREHLAPSGSLGGFLRNGTAAPLYRPSFERGMGDLVPTAAPPTVAAEEASARAEQGWDTLRRQFNDAPVSDPRLKALYARERVVVFSPCHARTDVDDDAESMRFSSSPGIALVADNVSGGLIENPELVTAAIDPGGTSAGRSAAWARLRENFRRGIGAATMPRAPSGPVAFGPFERYVTEGEGRFTRETEVQLRGTPTDLIVRYVTLERRTDPKTGQLSVKRTEKYCR